MSGHWLAPSLLRVKRGKVFCGVADDALIQSFPFLVVTWQFLDIRQQTPLFGRGFASSCRGRPSLALRGVIFIQMVNLVNL